MLGDGQLSKLTPIKQPDGTFVTTHIEQPGPIAYVESTTLQRIIDEDRNRCVVFPTDERPDQTRRILSAMARRKESNDGTDGCDEIVLKHHAAQRMLKRVHVVVPFAKKLAAKFPCQRTDTRRSFGQMLSTIEAVTVLHQYQRVKAAPEDGMVIEATRQDYEIARYLIAEPFARAQAGGRSPASDRFLQRVRDNVQGEFTSAEVMKWEKNAGDVQTVRGYLRVLADSGAVQVVEPARGNKPAVYRLPDAPPTSEDVCGLPSPDELFGGQANRAPPCSCVKT
jgi:hypothetical protein